jgi:serine/threonine protein kinase
VPLTSGVHLGPYEIFSLLGSRGMGEVYRGRDPRLGRDVAIKVFPSNASSDPVRLRRFEQDARAAAALNHPNILAVYEVGVDQGAPYIVSELLDGQTLRERLKSGPIPVPAALDYAAQIAHGLSAAHEQGIVHRGLKPDSLFVTKDGRVKILDFGLARLIDQESTGVVSSVPTSPAGTSPALVFGTTKYMSPEQVRGASVDGRTDVFALGVVLFEMLTGRSILALDDAYAMMSPSLEQLIRRCLDKDPAQRFQLAQDLARALSAIEAVSTSSTTTPVASTPVSVSPVTVKRRPDLPIAMMVLAALASGAILAMVNGC